MISGTFGIVYKVLDNSNQYPDEEIALKIVQSKHLERTAEYDILNLFSTLVLKPKPDPLTKWLLTCRGKKMYDATEHTIGIPMKYIPHVPFSVLIMSAK